MTVVPRNRWCTVPQASWWRPSRMRLPAAEVWLHHGAAGSSSTATANGYAAYHIRDKQWGEIGYSFVVAGGRVLEGRGAGVEGAHTYGRNAVSHGICLAGNYQSRQPATEDLDALIWLLQHGHDNGWWSTPAFTGGHRDAPGASTTCPGDRLQQAIPDLNRRAQASEPEDDMPLSDDDVARVARAVNDWRSSPDRTHLYNAALLGAARSAECLELVKRMAAQLPDGDVLLSGLEDQAVRAETLLQEVRVLLDGRGSVSADGIVDELVRRLSS